MATATDARGNTSVFSYDAERHRVTATSAAPSNYLTQFVYDKNGRVTETRAKTGNLGRPERVTTTTYTLSDKPATVIDAAGNATSYGYDDADRAVQVTDAEGRITQQTYTNDNQPFETQQIVAGAPVTVKTVTYTPNGQTLTLKDANNNVTTYSYDDFDRLRRPPTRTARLSPLPTILAARWPRASPAITT